MVLGAGHADQNRSGNDGTISRLETYNVVMGISNELFPTATKEAKTHADLDLLTWWSELMVVPCVAIGGITVQNAAPLIAAGADFLAVSSGIWDHEGGPDAAVKAFNDLFQPGL